MLPPPPSLALAGPAATPVLRALSELDVLTGVLEALEHGYIRLHHFDADYLDMKDPVPEDEPAE